jgi:FKBP-type peptidyl-prolyl cis-trans isomerase SlyD
MEARDDCVVGISYVLRDGQGEELERRETTEPLYYLHGHENIIPALEDTLSGLEEGDEFDVEFAPEEAYGEYNPNMIQRVGRDQFPDGLDLKPGTPVQLVAEGGAGSAIFYVKEIAGDEVVLDGNQPLAGKTLQFEGQVVDVREATDEEIDHGHAHVGDHH